MCRLQLEAYFCKGALQNKIKTNKNKRQIGAKNTQKTSALSWQYDKYLLSWSEGGWFSEPV